MPLAYTTATLAKELAISEEAVLRAVNEGLLEPVSNVHGCRGWWFPAEEAKRLLQYIKEGKLRKAPAIKTQRKKAS
jgi:hypothetical protein